MKKRWIIALAVPICLALVGAVWAQVSPNFDLSWHVIGGGGRDMTSTTHTHRGTLGQFAIGPATSSSHHLGAGYWYGIRLAPTFGLYLPLVTKNAIP